MSKMGGAISERCLAALREEKDLSQESSLLKQLIGLCADNQEEAKVFLLNNGLNQCWRIIHRDEGDMTSCSSESIEVLFFCSFSMLKL